MPHDCRFLQGYENAPVEPFGFLRSDRAIEVCGAHPSKTAKGGAASGGVIQSKINQVGQPPIRCNIR